ncbi:MAG: exodeoxyribonuclease VII small subunit [Bacteroidales bacterium]|jgi:exodeoxyribonuclease VII small subunit|nr:exodeoxyribonuclease VII small subunit [Bacteroidales bacterium]MDD2264189.1 exodeoxyribonuclease VII small subunit [Bacteroidales bacterium]MDD2831339.1 exodeoxyribonuclease VII small subunit [Bacteroidales bacterium]MDD3208334.1 exodeoxyribonuclease VII small subunit [Bacteroidales bacterium]MDD3696983.1 exodeoxyribonuclease VII small subunit [Bacteroidales bacterium]
MKKKTEMTYQQARQELETLVEELEQPDADLGQIASKVKRALELVAFCRNYLRKVHEDAETTLDAYDKG